MMCEVCDTSGAGKVFYGYSMHESCAPKYWVADHKDLEQFVTRVYEWWATAPAWKRKWDGS